MLIPTLSLWSCNSKMFSDQFDVSWLKRLTWLCITQLFDHKAFCLCIKDRCVNVVLLFLCREMLYTGWHVRCMQPAGRGPLPQWEKGWWRETVSRWPEFFAPQNSGESLSALRDLTVQFKKNVATDNAVKTSVCRINYEVVTYLVLDDWWWRKDSDSVSSLQKVKDFSVFSVEKFDHKRWMFTNWNPLKSVLQNFQL